MKSAKPASPRQQRAMVAAAWFGIVVLGVIALVAVTHDPRLPSTIWDYSPGGRTGPASLGRQTLSEALVLLWAGLLVYSVPLVPLTIVWLRLAQTARARAGVMYGIVISAIFGWVIVFLFVVSFVPQLISMPQTRAQAWAEFSPDSIWIGFSLIALAILCIAAGYFVTRFSAPPTGPAGEQADLEDGLVTGDNPAITSGN